MIIGITDCSKFNNYRTWIARDGVEVVRLSYKQNNFEEIKKCSGVVLSGGEDVHPRFYNKPEYLSDCEVNEKRDDFEWKVLEYVTGEGVPLLGICRGLQITNVFFGGTLIPDIYKNRKTDHTKLKSGDRYHSVNIEAGTLLHAVAGQLSGEINSSHHQSADTIGTGLKANAFSMDGIIEGLEREKMEGLPFLLLVQWHPERMKDLESSFSRNVRESFLKSCL